MGKETLIVRSEFAKRLKAYRKAANISQKNLAHAIGKQQPYIVLVEGGEYSFGIDILEMISQVFGVKFYEFLDPKFPIPSEEELHNSIKAFVSSTETDTSYLNNKSPNYARNMDIYLETNLLNEQKTSTEIAQDYFVMFNEKILPAKVSDVLTKGRRSEIIEVIKPEAGRGNLYRKKNKEEI